MSCGGLGKPLRTVIDTDELRSGSGLAITMGSSFAIRRLT
jgi:hypothetical protein